MHMHTHTDACTGSQVREGSRNKPELGTLTANPAPTPSKSWSPQAGLEKVQKGKSNNGGGGGLHVVSGCGWCTVGAQ